MTLSRRLFQLGLVLLLLSSAPAAAASRAEHFIKGKHEELLGLVKKAKGPDDEKKLEKALDEVFDYDALARDSLRKYWGDLTPEQQTEFRDTLKGLVRAAYRKSLKKIVDYRVEYLGEAKGKGGQLVRTRATSRDKARADPVSIDYVVRVDAKGAYIVNIVTEGSSLVDTYYGQFRRIIEKKGFPELMKRMKKKLAEG